MKAVGFIDSLPIGEELALRDFTLARPKVRPRDVLVAVKAVSVNPVDTKIRLAGNHGSEPRILGWDAAGEIVQVGDSVRDLRVGDRVYYAGDITRPGSNSELHAVDERIAAKMPRSLDFADAAALPLTGLTAWEALFERMGISPYGAHASKSVLIVGGAGGVGSLAIQLAKRVAKLKVIATASRPETTAWVETLGADAVINHREPLDEGIRSLGGSGHVDYILCLNSTEEHWEAMCRAIAPQGTIASIVETADALDLAPLKSKSARFAWEFMFTRSMYETDDIATQGEILGRIATYIDDGTLQGTANTRLSPIDAATLRRAHAMLESGRTIGKVVAAEFRDQLLDTFEGQKTLLRGTLQTFAVVLGEPFAQVFKPIGSLV